MVWVFGELLCEELSVSSFTRHLCALGLADRLAV